MLPSGHRVLLTLAATAQAQIIWGTPKTITGPGNIFEVGSPIDAIGVNNFGSSPFVDGSGAIKVGDTTFNPFFSNSTITAADFGGGSDGSHSNATPYLSVLNGVAYSGFSETPVHGTITLNGLITNATYQVEVWNPGGRQTNLVGGNTVTLSDEYVLGSFVATSSSESFTVSTLFPGSPGAPGDAGEISAVALREIPEPSTYAMLIAALVVLVYSIRLSRKRSRIE